MTVEAPFGGPAESAIASATERSDGFSARTRANTLERPTFSASPSSYAIDPSAPPTTPSTRTASWNASLSKPPANAGSSATLVATATRNASAAAALPPAARPRATPPTPHANDAHPPASHRRHTCCKAHAAPGSSHSRWARTSTTNSRSSTAFIYGRLPAATGTLLSGWRSRDLASSKSSSAHAHLRWRAHMHTDADTFTVQCNQDVLSTFCRQSVRACGACDH